jgi:hypothetical protein
MEHSFDIKLAGIVGIEKAIILKNIHWWITTNEKNESQKHFHDGMFWTYNSAKALAELFPYMKERSILRWLNELATDGWVVIGNYNSKKYDLTQWFARGPQYDDYLAQNADPYIETAKKAAKSPRQNGGGIKESPRQNGETIRQNGETIRQNGGPIPDINPNINPNVAEEEAHNGGGFNKKDKFSFDFNDAVELDERLTDIFLAFAPEIKRHWANLDVVKKEIIDLRPELPKKECWRIIVESFMVFPALPKEKAHLNYLLRVIQGKKNDYCADLAKTRKTVVLKEADKMRRDEEKRAAENEKQWENEVLRTAESMLKNNAAWFKITEVEQLTNAIKEKMYLRIDRICNDVRIRNEAA